MGGFTTEVFSKSWLDAKAMGFDALGHLHPFLDEPRSQPYKGTYASMILEAVDRVGKIRATAGGNVDLCLELQRRMKRGEAIALAHAVEKYNPMSWRISPLRGHVKLGSGDVDVSD